MELYKLDISWKVCLNLVREGCLHEEEGSYHLNQVEHAPEGLVWAKFGYGVERGESDHDVGADWCDLGCGDWVGVDGGWVSRSGLVDA